MKTSRFKFEYRKNASKLHQAIGECLRTSPLFCNYPTYQEYPVSRVNPNCLNSRLRFDWVIPSLKLVIEGHGIQHYEMQTFGMELEESIDAFLSSQYRDKLKEEYALAAGYSYIVIPWNQEVTDDLIYRQYLTNLIEEDIHLPKSRHELELEKKREYQKQLYRKTKERRRD